MSSFLRFVRSVFRHGQAAAKARNIPAQVHNSIAEIVPPVGSHTELPPTAVRPISLEELADILDADPTLRARYADESELAMLLIGVRTGNYEQIRPTLEADALRIALELEAAKREAADQIRDAQTERERPSRKDMGGPPEPAVHVVVYGPPAGNRNV